MNSAITYDQTSAKLEISGLPDMSSNQDNQKIGIISSWKLSLVGFPELEGRREHLESLMKATLEYSRYCLSRTNKSSSNKDDLIKITSVPEGHQLALTSTKEGVEPLIVKLDDAQLADLVRCLDDLRYDQRVSIDWNLLPYRPLAHRDLYSRKPLTQRLSAPILGISSVITLCFVFAYSPMPENIDLLLNDGISSEEQFRSE